MNYFLLSFFALVIPRLASAQGAQTGDGVVIELPNPIAVGSMQDVLVAIINIVMVFAIPIIVFFIIYAGFLYVTARGNPETIGKAHRALLYAIIGGVLILGAEALSLVIQGTVNDFRQ